MIDFEVNGVVSIWVGSEDNNFFEKKDILYDLAGVDYYDEDFQEGVSASQGERPNIEELLSQLSFSESFLDKAVLQAKNKGLDKAVWVIMQIDYSYDPNKIRDKIISDEPVFLGVFEYQD